MHTPLCGLVLHFATDVHDLIIIMSPSYIKDGRPSPAVACWVSDHWGTSSNPLGGGGGGGKFCH